MSNRAWVTLATNDSYGLGALVVAHSLRRSGSLYPAVVLITPSVTEAMRERLRAVFAEVVVVDVLDSKDAAHLALLQRPELGITFTKIHCWNLTQYEKCVFLDADTLIVQNCDELFEREELSAAPDVGWPDCFNSGVFVFSPSVDTFSNLITFASERGSFDGGDQGLLNSYFSDWARGDINKHLPFLYNVTSAAFYSYIPALKHYGQNLKIIHFIGAAKPWLQQFNWQSRSVDAPEHLRGFLQLWWDLFVGQVHSQLDTAMTGVAGNLARVVPGAPLQQEAVDELTRRQGWEAGNIDYMGADSFDNIWAKISQTLSQPPSSEQPEPPKDEAQPEAAAEPPSAPTAVETVVEPASETAPAAPASEPAVVTPENTAEAPKQEVEAEKQAPSEPASVEVPAPVESDTAEKPSDTPAAQSAEDAAVVEPAPVEVAAPASAPASEATEASTPAPEATEASTPAPEATEAPTAASEAPTPEAPTPAPEITEAPTPAPEVTEAPASAPEVTEAPAPAPEVTETPGKPEEIIPVPVEAATVDIAASAPADVSEKTEPEAAEIPVTALEALKIDEAPSAAEVAATKEQAAPEPASSAPESTPAPSEEPKPAEGGKLEASSDSPPLANTPSKEEIPVAPAAKSEERHKLGKLLLPPPAADAALTPDSEAEDAAALAQSIIAGELRTPTVTEPTPPVLASPPAPPADSRLSVQEPAVPTPPIAVSLSQIGIKAKPTTAAQIESSVKPDSAPSTPDSPKTADPPKKKIIKKVVKKDKEGASGSEAPVPPPRKKEKKPKEK